MPRASSPRQRPRNPWQRLCRGLPSAKTPRGIFRRRRGLCRGPFIGHSAKPLPTTLGKEKKPSGAGAVGGFFAEGRPSANNFFYFFLKNLCRGPPPWPSAKKFSGFFKNSLPRAGPRQRNGFFEFLTLCRGPTP